MGGRERKGVGCRLGLETLGGHFYCAYRQEEEKEEKKEEE